MTPSNDELNDLLQRGYRYALALAHDASLAEDLLQEACTALARTEGPWHVGYLFRVVRHRFIDERRRADRRDETASDRPEPAVPDDTELVASREEVEHALGLLKVPEREVVFLSVVEGYTAQEIADLRRCPRGTVLSTLYRAKARLRELLERRGREELHEPR